MPEEVVKPEPLPKALNIGFDEDPKFDSKNLFAKKPKLKNQSLLQQKLNSLSHSNTNSVLETIPTRRETASRIASV